MYERFTDTARNVMKFANMEAQRFYHEYIGTEHILLGILKEATGVASKVIQEFDIDSRKVRMEVERLLQYGPQMVMIGRFPQTPRAKKVIEYAMEEAQNFKHSYVGDEHLLLGLLRENQGVAAMVLMSLGMELVAARECVLKLFNEGTDDRWKLVIEQEEIKRLRSAVNILDEFVSKIEGRKDNTEMKAELQWQSKKTR